MRKKLLLFLLILCFLFTPQVVWAEDGYVTGRVFMKGANGQEIGIPGVIIFKMDKENLYGEIRCSQKQQHIYQIIEKNHHIKKEFWGGYSRNNEIWRQKLIDKNVISEELITANNAMMMYEPLLEAKNN